MNIECVNLLKEYPNFVLKIDELNIAKGEVIKLYGNNGAGKTTLLYLILDLINRTGGHVLLDGEINSKVSEWKKKTASYLGESFLIQFLKVSEYLNLLCDVYKIDKKQIEELYKYVIEFTDVKEIEHIRISKLSTGNKVKIGILGTLLVQPDLLILDEPTANLDPRSKVNLIKLLKDYSEKNNATILISSHDLDIVNRLKGRSLVLSNGSIVYDQIDGKTSIGELEELMLLS